MSSVSNHIISSHNPKAPCVAHLLSKEQRKQIAISVLEKTKKVSHIAFEHGTSRKFIYEQKEKALAGIAQAFEKKSKHDEHVLFYIPVTYSWIKQLVLSLILICKAPYNGVVELFRDLFDYSISKGTVHNIVHSTLNTAQEINQQQDLSNITVGAHDEIYQAGQPVLAGCCAHSTYCYLLSQEDSCDATTWGVHLLNLQQQGLNPDHTIADGGASARKGQEDAWPDTPCHGDVFHALHPFSKMIAYIDNRASDAAKLVEELSLKIINPRGKWKGEEQQSELLQKIAGAEKESKKVAALAADLKVLYKWLREDILSLVGPSYKERKDLLEFVIEELRFREEVYTHRIQPMRKYLENHKDNLLEFVPKMEKELLEISIDLQVPLEMVQDTYRLKGGSVYAQSYWETYAALQNRLGGAFYAIECAVEEVLNHTVRASSLIENLNSRLRNYFTLRRHLGNKYLEILRFFLNHRRFMRSDLTERIGKSPAELLSGQKHKHWLEMLGFDLFKQAA